MKKKPGNLQNLKKIFPNPMIKYSWDQEEPTFEESIFILKIKWHDFILKGLKFIKDKIK